MNIEDDMAVSHDLPNPKSPTPTKPTEEISPEKNSHDVVFTRTTYTTPGASIVLTKRITKEESPSLEKGKAKLDLGSYSSFSAGDVYAGYLSRLHSSHDTEAGLVNLMKELFEVNTEILLI